MGDMDLDAGVPGPTESAVIGRSGIAKAMWLALTILVLSMIANLPRARMAGAR